MTVFYTDSEKKILMYVCNEIGGSALGYDCIIFYVVQIVLDYEWPELERSDEVIHMFAGMINRLINVAETEFTTQTTKKKLVCSTFTS